MNIDDLSRYIITHATRFQKELAALEANPEAGRRTERMALLQGRLEALEMVRVWVLTQPESQTTE